MPFAAALPSIASSSVSSDTPMLDDSVDTLVDMEPKHSGPRVLTKKNSCPESDAAEILATDTKVTFPMLCQS